MPLQFEEPSFYTVTGIEPEAAALLIAAGGRLNRQPEFIHVFMPQGTARKSVQDADYKPNNINKGKSNLVLIKLPTGIILKLKSHYISCFKDDDDD